MLHIVAMILSKETLRWRSTVLDHYFWTSGKAFPNRRLCDGLFVMWRDGTGGPWAPSGSLDRRVCRGFFLIVDMRIRITKVAKCAKRPVHPRSSTCRKPAPLSKIPKGNFFIQASEILGKQYESNGSRLHLRLTLGSRDAETEETTLGACGMLIPCTYIRRDSPKTD